MSIATTQEEIMPRILIKVSKGKVSTLIKSIDLNPANEERKLTNDEFKDLLIKAKKLRETFYTDNLQSKTRLTKLYEELSTAKTKLSNDTKVEIENLDLRIQEISNLVENIQRQLYRKQTGTFSKLFVKKETIEQLESDLQVQTSNLKVLNEEREESQRDINNVLASQVNFSKSKFFSRFIAHKEDIERLQKEIEQALKVSNKVQQQYKNAKANIVIEFDDALSEQYAKVASAFHDLKDSNKIWDITSKVDGYDAKSSVKTTVIRKEVKFALRDIDFIESEEPAFYLENANGSHFYIYPAFIVLMNSLREFSLIELNQLQFEFIKQRFIEEVRTIPADSKIIDYAWAKVNKDGSPDLRFKGNYQTPVVGYGLLNFRATNLLDETYHVSNLENAEKFGREFKSYLALINSKAVSKNTPTITESYFKDITQFSEEFVHFIQKLKSNSSFYNFISNVKGLEKYMAIVKEKGIELLILADVLKCFNSITDLYNFQSKESFAVIFLQAKLYKAKDISYSNYELLYSPSVLDSYKNVYKSLKNEFTSVDETSDMFYKMSYVLNSYDKELNEEYLSNLYQFASIVIKADGTVTPKEEEVLKRIKRPINVQLKEEQQPIKVQEVANIGSLDEVLEELNSLTGLDAVKQEIKSLINYIRIQKAREASGLRSSNLSYHIVFTGSPGTGKTTVARIIAKIYKCLGVISGGQLVETDRAGLVAEYVGQTAVKVNKAVDSAMNGVLFIDEAYSIVGKNNDDFGKEAVATLIKRIEDDRDRLIVVLAGYTKEMKDFIDTNPGFKSRFNRYIEFPDYSPNELISIYEGMCAKHDYILQETAKPKIKELFEKAFAARDKSFGNGRFVRNIFEKTLEKQADRLASVTSLDKETLTTITGNDIP